MPEPTTTVDSLLRAVAHAPDAPKSRGLVVGTVIDGAFEIVGEIGRGGIGVVYRAIDLRLDRQVAIKVMRVDRWAHVSAAERAALVEREARATARLRHPSIVTLHDVGVHDGAPYLVLELLHGESLARRLRRPLPLPVARAVMRQVAAALAHAHAEGVLHRDLKPHNVIVTEDDHAWVLDFGLAAMLRPTDPLDPTHAARAGTPGYMAPEQREGAAQDVRTDVWALGLLLYQVVTAYEPPPLASADELDAAPWRSDLDRLAPAVAGIIDRAVRWRPGDRTPSAAAFLADLDALDVVQSPWRDVAVTRLRWGWALAGAATVGVAVATAASLPPSPPSTSEPVALAEPVRPPSVRFTVDVPPTEPFAAFQGPMVAVAPDGRSLVYQGRPPVGTRGTSQLYLRRFDEDEATPIDGTVDAEGPMFSPDGASIAYAVGGELTRRPLAGGDVVSLCGVQAGFRGGTWTRDDRIVYAPSWFSGLFVVGAAGGEPQPLTTLGPGEKSHRFPHVLPEANAVLFVSSHARTDSFDDATIEAVSLHTGERTAITTGGAPRFVAPGTLLVPRHGALWAMPFDPIALAITGPPVSLVEGMVTASNTGAAAFDVGGGTLAYFEGGRGLFDTRVVRVAEDRSPTPLPVPVRATTSVRRAPDGRLLLRVDSANASLWMHDLAREIDTRVTSTWDADHAVCAPDARHVFFVITRGAEAAIVRRRTDGLGEDETLWVGVSPANLELSRDGTVLVFDDRDPQTGSADVMWMPADGSGAPTRVTETVDETEAQPALSPDGRWIAFTASLSGRDEVYVQAFRGAGTRVQISAHGGRWPRWSEDGRALVFRNGAEVLEASFEPGEPPQASRPRVRFAIDDVDDPARRSFDLLPDGSLVTVVRPDTWRPADRLRVVVGWSP